MNFRLFISMALFSGMQLCALAAETTAPPRPTAPATLTPPASLTPAARLTPAPRPTNSAAFLKETFRSMDSLDNKQKLGPGDRIAYRVIEDQDEPRELLVTDS